MLASLFERCAGLDVHRETIVATLLKGDGADFSKEVKEYRTFGRELKSLAGWLKSEGARLVVMESTGVYWKAVYEALEEEDLTVLVVNARHVRQVPGRKTDVSDSEWLAELGRCGLLRGSFIPPRDLREIRLLTRYRVKLVRMLASEKNRLHKVLDDCGVRLGNVVSDIDGVSARKMISALIKGKHKPEEIAEMALGSLRQKKEELCQSLEARISDRHRYLLQGLERHLGWLRREIGRLDAKIVSAMEPYGQEWRLLQTIPGLNEISAAMLLAEIGPEMNKFRSKEHLSSWAGYIVLNPNHLMKLFTVGVTDSELGDGQWRTGYTKLVPEANPAD